jgi:recombination protein RecA
MEKGLDIAQKLMQSKEIFMLVIDSVGGASPKAEMEGEMEDNTVGLRARIMNKFVRKIAGLNNDLATDEDVNLGNTTLLAINQVYTDIMSYGAPDITPGGRQLPFFASIRVKIRRSNLASDEEGTMLAQQSTCVVEKNKTYKPKGKAIFWFSVEDNDKGRAGEIWKLGEILTLGVTTGIIAKGGKWYTLPEMFGVEKPFGGVDAITAWALEQPPEVIMKLENLILGEVLKKGI